MSSQYSEGCEAHDKMVDFRTKKKKKKKEKILQFKFKASRMRLKFIGILLLYTTDLFPFFDEK